MFLENDIIRLRALEPEDLEILYKWENDTSLWRLGNTLAPYSRFEIKQYISSAHDIFETKQLRLMIELKRTLETIGTIDIFDYEPYHKRACIGMLVDLKFQNKGLGKAALLLLSDYVFSFLNLHQIYAYIPKKNVASINLFKSAKFEQCGLLRDWLSRGEETGFEDVYLFCLRASRFTMHN